MKLRREAKSLKAKAISSLKIGLEAFNGFSEDGRTTKTLLHLQHACEMLLKACLVQRQVNIQDPQKGHSVGFKKCLNLAREHCGFNETQAGVFRAVDSMRDGEQHWLIMVPEDVLFLHARGLVTAIDEVLAREFGEKLADYLPTLWSANAAMKSLFDTLNIVYGETEKRGFLKLNALSLSFTVVAIGFVVAALAAVVVVPVVLNYLGLSHFADLVVRISRWPAMFVVLALALACVYRFGPSRAAPRWRWITWGSAAATIMWLAASGLFSWYATNFGKFNETYGSLGAVIGFMTWLWLSAIVVLLGAELDAEMEHQTAHDTTASAPKPMGARGAKMADTVGAARNGA